MRSLAVSSLLVLASCQASKYERPALFGVEANAYPTGQLIGPRGELRIGDADAIYGRAAVHLVDREGDGEHDREDGSGYTGGVGWRHWLDDFGDDWFFGGRLELSRLALGWTDDGPGGDTGNTSVTVLTPMIEGGYSWWFDAGPRLDLTVSLGREFNVDTDGATVGEDAILMFGVSLSGGTRSVLRLNDRFDRPAASAPERDTVSSVGVH